MKKLSDILKNIEVSETYGSLDVIVKEVCFDSRYAGKNSLFIAVKGTRVDGHEYIRQAIKNGARAVICENLPDSLNDNITFIKTENSGAALGLASSAFYDHPSANIKLIGVTGTNGKSTIVTLLHELFISLGYQSGLISTIRNKVHTVEIPSTHTTPDAVSINKLLAGMVEKGCEYCFMEVSSHAIDQHRVEGLCFSGVIFTNLTHDHLDYHKDFTEYLKAKKKLFDGLPETSFALTNSDDKNGQVMIQNTHARKYSYSLKHDTDFKCRIIENQLDGLQLSIDHEEVWFKMAGRFNAYNILAVYATAILLGQNKEDILTQLSILPGAEGRFEIIHGTMGVIGIVDYAHSPDAVMNVLSTINEVRSGKGLLITVIGAGGDRDSLKRPLMANVAARLSDQVILTSDNPRSENPEKIIADMRAGVEITNKRKVIEIVNRKEAIRAACMMARPGDIIVVAGKGHENYQEIMGVKYPFDDREVMKESLMLKSN